MKDGEKELYDQQDNTHETLSQITSGSSLKELKEVKEKVINDKENDLIRLAKEQKKIEDKRDEIESLIKESCKKIRKKENASFLDFMVTVKELVKIDGFGGTLLPEFYKLYKKYKQQHPGSNALGDGDDEKMEFID